VAKMLEDRCKTRILIVDDEHIIADTLALILQKNGFEVRAVYSGDSAVKTAMVLKPDVLISDVVMDGMNGIEAAIQICESVPGCRVILFSGNAATAHLLENAEAEGYCFELLSKPIHPRVLLDHLMSTRISMTG
jgi:CheY-like chemotaxis protein